MMFVVYLFKKRERNEGDKKEKKEEDVRLFSIFQNDYCVGNYKL